MKTLSNPKTDLKKNVAYKKSVYNDIKIIKSFLKKPNKIKSFE